ncbi:MAG TPA: metallophosphoesterase, partial [Pirellulales bacterium]|nr:metallophosphoesterase [Pirellulales bacterium]
MARPMPAGLNRRTFLAGGAALASATALGMAAEPRDDFSFLALGDTHFDRLEHHDMRWLAAEHPGDVAQVQHYSEHAATLLPQLLKTVADQCRRSAPSVDCLVHVGDLVEGLCGQADLASKHCRDALTFLEQAELGVPLLLTKGNHDVTGPGAAEAYRDELLPYLGRQVNDRLTSARYAVRRRDCLFVMYDSYE